MNFIEINAGKRRFTFGWAWDGGRALFTAFVAGMLACAFVYVPFYNSVKEFYESATFQQAVVDDLREGDYSRVAGPVSNAVVRFDGPECFGCFNLGDTVEDGCVPSPARVAP